MFFPLQRLTVCLLALVSLLIPRCAFAQSGADTLHKFFAHVFEEQLADQPEFATTIGRHDRDDRWNDWSKNGLEQRRRHMQQVLRDLDAISLEGASAEDRLSARLLRYDTQRELESFDLQNHLLRVGQLFGLHNRVYVLVDRMPSRTAHDYENILARLRAIPAYVDQNIAILDEATQHGVVQPRVVVDLVVQQLDAQLAQDQAATALLAPFRNFPSNFPADVQAKLTADGTAAYQKDFLPAWRKLRDYLAGPYAGKSRASIGVSALPGGLEAYRVLIRRATTTDMTPEEIHKLGEEEVKRIEAEMLEIVHQTGFTGTIAEFEHKMDETPEQHFRSQEEMLVYCRNIAKIIEPNLPAQFEHIPMLLYGVRPIPADREKSTATNAQAPSPDGSTPGWFNLNTYQPEKQFKSNKEALVLHEAVPGHIFQISLAHAMQDLPDFRKFYGNSAYVEGWALYAESLGSQLGLYKDPYSRYGQLSSERFRAVRLVVDTGIHAMGWTRDQAVEYFRAHAPDQSLAEVDRYISWPGQALSYKLGQLKITQLRQEAERRLGAKFDVREFHDVILRGGVMPLDLLQEEATAYIDTKK
jgi:uncharacterized protein (DUF885 family)